ncbi:juvenile hormone acid O-methyltransferase-like [Tubulanus polymorphus]|uniref:juvenile hormone acid O-methyltransferase-like n=1 Tax=Tubulanus polymorphus TaxID=672921 RepID=UPI003DA417D1
MNPDPYVYSCYNHGPQKWATETLNMFEPLHPNPMSVLDIGCGTGEVTHFLLDKFRDAEVLALDKNKAMVDFAKENNSHPRIEYITADIQRKTDFSPEMKNGYDLAFSFLCLQWVDDQRSTLENIFNLLKDQGECLFALGTKPSQAFLSLLKEIQDHPRWRPYLQKFCPNLWNTSSNGLIRWRVPDPISGYSALLRGAGFTIVSATSREFQYVPETDDKCKGMLEILMPHVRAIPENIRPEFMDDALDIFITHCPKTSSGQTLWQPKLLLFHCAKDRIGPEVCGN